MNLYTWTWFGIYLFPNEKTEGKSIMGHQRSRKIVDAGVVGCTMGDRLILVVNLLELRFTRSQRLPNVIGLLQNLNAWVS